MSVNAGDQALYVGGQGINKEFLELFQQTQKLQQGNGKGSYKTMHRDLLCSQYHKKIRIHPMCVSSWPLQWTDEPYLKLQESACKAGDGHPGDPPGYDGCTGAVFIDVFNEKSRPLNIDNVAMLYVVGPRGEGCRRVGGRRNSNHSRKLDAKTSFHSNVS